MKPSEAGRILYEELGFCCGNPDEVFALVKTMLGKCGRTEGGGVYDMFRSVKVDTGGNFDIDPQHSTLLFAVLYWLTHVDLLDHGVGCAGSFLTDKGRGLLAAMTEHTREQLEDAYHHWYTYGDEPA